MNTASQHILTYASGINKSQANSIVEYRTLHGPFQTREDIKSVKGIGKVAFQNAAGFLRITDGDEPLDSTIIHPEKYNIVKSLLSSAFSSFNNQTDDSTTTAASSTKTSKTSTAAASKRKKNTVTINNENIRSLLFSQQLRNYFESSACDWNLHASSLNEDVDNLKLLARWISDPYFNATNQVDIRNLKGIPPKLTRKCILSPNDFHIGMEVSGTVRNITTFGVFIDIGSKEDGLLHRSKFGKKTEFIIGEVLQCYIIEINEQKGGKISLSLSQSDCPIVRDDGTGQLQAPRSVSATTRKHEDYQSDDETRIARNNKKRSTTETVVDESSSTNVVASKKRRGEKSETTPTTTTPAVENEPKKPRKSKKLTNKEE